MLLQLALTELGRNRVCSLLQLLLPMRQWTWTKQFRPSLSADCTAGVLRLAAVLDDQLVYCADVLCPTPLLLDIPAPGPKASVLLCCCDVLVCAAGTTVMGVSSKSLAELWRLQLSEPVDQLVGLGSSSVCAIVTDARNTHVASLVDGKVRLLVPHHGGLPASMQLVEGTWLVSVQHKLLSVHQLREDNTQAICLAETATESWLPVTKARRQDNNLEVLTATVEGNVLQYLVALEQASHA